MYSGLQVDLAALEGGGGDLAGAEADAGAVDGVAVGLERLGVDLGHDPGFVEAVGADLDRVGLLPPPSRAGAEQHQHRRPEGEHADQPHGYLLLSRPLVRREPANHTSGPMTGCYQDARDRRGSVRSGSSQPAVLSVGHGSLELHAQPGRGQTPLDEREDSLGQRATRPATRTTPPKIMPSSCLGDAVDEVAAQPAEAEDRRPGSAVATTWTAAERMPPAITGDGERAARPGAGSGARACPSPRAGLDEVAVDAGDARRRC